MMYSILPQATYSSADGYALSTLREGDMPAIKEWRNAQLEVLRQARPLTDADQARYFEQHVAPSFTDPRPRIVLLRFTLRDELIGYGGLTNLEWDSRRGEVSFLLDPARVTNPARYEADFAAFLALLKAVAFDGLALHRLFTETFDIRPHHVAILERAGFRLEGRMCEHARVGERLVDSLIHGLIRGQADG